MYTASYDGDDIGGVGTLVTPEGRHLVFEYDEEEGWMPLAYYDNAEDQIGKPFPRCYTPIPEIIEALDNSRADERIKREKIRVATLRGIEDLYD